VSRCLRVEARAERPGRLREHLASSRSRYGLSTHLVRVHHEPLFVVVRWPAFLRDGIGKGCFEARRARHCGASWSRRRCIGRRGCGSQTRARRGSERTFRWANRQRGKGHSDVCREAHGLHAPCTARGRTDIRRGKDAIASSPSSLGQYVAEIRGSSHARRRWHALIRSSHAAYAAATVGMKSVTLKMIKPAAFRMMGFILPLFLGGDYAAKRSRSKVVAFVVNVQAARHHSAARAEVVPALRYRQRRLRQSTLQWMLCDFYAKFLSATTVEHNGPELDRAAQLKAARWR